MRLFKTSQVILALCLNFLVAPSALATDPGGSLSLGWADRVVSYSQGFLGNGLPVAATGSDPTAALGVTAGGDPDTRFFSLGFGGNIVLGFTNGISSGTFVVDSRNPDEQAKAQVSENGTAWLDAGIIVPDGSINLPPGIGCARYLKITDISDPLLFMDGMADGYDVYGVRAIGYPCSPQSNPNVPGFPNTGTEGSCAPSGTISVPIITQAIRVSPTSIFVSWENSENLNNFVLQYGFENRSSSFSQNISGSSTILNDLPRYRPVWVRVAGADNCAVGNFSEQVISQETGRIDAPGDGSIVGNIVPLLPNTGFGPQAQNISLR